MPDDKRYKTGRWVKLRAQVLERDHYECQECKHAGKVSPASVVHHVKDSKRYPLLMFDPDNLVSLCRDCHERIHDRRGRRRPENERFPEWW